MTDDVRRINPTGNTEGRSGSPEGLYRRLLVWRWLILRRTCQVSVLLLFFGTVHWGWSIADRPLLTGNLSGSEFMGFLPMADPFAALQILLTRHMLESQVLIGAAVILVFYALVGGRVWCSWVCPVNMVSDAAAGLRRLLPVGNVFSISRSVRYWVLGLALALSALTGVAAFEWVSPIGMFHRELIFGIGFGWAAVLGVFLFELLILRHGWCGHLCPLGAFYALIGRFAQVRMRFDAPTCTRCGECVQVCPEPQVLNLNQAAAAGMVASGECTNCGRCTSVCPEDTLHFDLRVWIARHNVASRPEISQRRAA